MPLAPQSRWSQRFSSRSTPTVSCHRRSHTTMSKPHEHTNKLERGRKTAISENVIGFYRVREGDLFGGLSFYTNQTHAWRIQHQSQAVDSCRALPSSFRAAVFNLCVSCRAAWS